MGRDRADCERCRTPQSDALDQIGEVEYEEFFDGKARETRTHFVCRICGAKWVRIIESGVGGHGDNWNPE